MVRKIFVAATGQHCGKTTTSLLLVRAARQFFGRVGFMKPVGQEFREVAGLRVDKDALLMAEVFELQRFLAHMSPVVADRGFTRQVLDGEISHADLQRSIERSFAELEKAFDAIVIEGTGHSGVGSVFGLNNAKVAALLGAPVTMVTGGGIGNVVDHVELALPLYREARAEVRGIVVNKIQPLKREQSIRYLSAALAPKGLKVVPGLDYNTKLANPRLESLARFLREQLVGDEAGRVRLVAAIQMGVASSQRVVDLLLPDTLLITASTRDELLVTLASLYDLPEHRARIAGLVICGAVPVSPITQSILDASRIPHIRTRSNSTAVLTRLMEFVAKLSSEDRSKLEWLFEHGERQLDPKHVESLFSS